MAKKGVSAQIKVHVINYKLIKKHTTGVSMLQYDHVTV